MSELSDWELSRFETAKAAFRTGQAMCDQHGMRLLVCYIPTKFRVYGGVCEFSQSSPCRQWRLWDLPGRFDRFCHDANIPFLDLTFAMRDAAAAGRLLYAAPDTHWDRDGHAQVAELLEKKCREFGLTGQGERHGD